MALLITTTRTGRKRNTVPFAYNPEVPTAFRYNQPLSTFDRLKVEEGLQESAQQTNRPEPVIKPTDKDI